MTLEHWQKTLESRRTLQISSALALGVVYLSGLSPSRFVLCLAPLLGNLAPWFVFGDKQAHRWVHPSLPWWQVGGTGALVAAGWLFPSLEPGWLVALGLAWLLAELAFWAPGDRIAWDTACGRVVLGSQPSRIVGSQVGSREQKREVKHARRAWNESVFLERAPFVWEAGMRVVFLAAATITMLHPDLRSTAPASIHGWTAVFVWAMVAALWIVAGVPRWHAATPASQLGRTIAVKRQARLQWPLISSGGCLSHALILLSGWVVVMSGAHEFLVDSLAAPPLLGGLIIIGTWFPSGSYFNARILTNAIALGGHLSARVESASALSSLHVRAVQRSEGGALESWPAQTTIPIGSSGAWWQPWSRDRGGASATAPVSVLNERLKARKFGQAGLMAVGLLLVVTFWGRDAGGSWASQLCLALVVASPLAANIFASPRATLQKGPAHASHRALVVGASLLMLGVHQVSAGHSAWTLVAWVLAAVASLTMGERAFWASVSAQVLAQPRLSNSAYRGGLDERDREIGELVGNAGSHEMRRTIGLVILTTVWLLASSAAQSIAPSELTVSVQTGIGLLTVLVSPWVLRAMRLPASDDEVWLEGSGLQPDIAVVSIVATLAFLLLSTRSVETQRLMVAAGVLELLWFPRSHDHLAKIRERGIVVFGLGVRFLPWESFGGLSRAAIQEQLREGVVPRLPAVAEGDPKVFNR